METILEDATSQLGSLMLPLEELGVLARACEQSCGEIEQMLPQFTDALQNQDTYELEVLLEQQQDMGKLNTIGHESIEARLRYLERTMDDVERRSGGGSIIGKILPYIAILFGILIALFMKQYKI